MLFKPTYGKLGHVWQGFDTIAGLKRINYGFGGALFRVRRGSDNTEKDFFSTEGVAAWVGAGNDGFVTKLYDQGGKGNDWTNDTTGQQPKLVNNGALITLQSKPMMDFSGGQVLKANRLIYDNDKLYCSTVCGAKQTNQTQEVLSHWNTSNNRAGWLLRFGSIGRQFVAFSNNGSLVSSFAYQTYSSNTVHIVEGLFSINEGVLSNQAQAYTDNFSEYNSAAAIGGDGTSINSPDIPLGLGTRFNGDNLDNALTGYIGEVMIKIDDNKAGLRAAIYNDINNRWGIV